MKPVLALLASLGMQVKRIEEGLWRWTAPHPDWKPGADWAEEVGCVYWEAPDSVVLIDPLLPPDGSDRTRFFEALDRDVQRVGSPVVVLITVSWHARSSREVAERYAGRVLGPDTVADGLPTGIQAFATVAANEQVYWLEKSRALVSGDVLIGTPAGGVRLSPVSWFTSVKEAEAVRRQLLTVLDLPVERVLVSHGEPVLCNGLEALRLALA